MHPRIPPHCLLFIYLFLSFPSSSFQDLEIDLKVREDTGGALFPTKTITVYNKDPQGVDLYVGWGCIFSLFFSGKKKKN